MDEHLDRRGSWVPWAITSAALLAVAAVAYFVGLQSSPAAVDGDTARHAWRGAHVGPLFFLLMFWVLGSRWLWWGPSWRYHPWHYRSYYGPWPRDVRAEWEEWHREAHRRADGGHGSDQVRDPQRP